MKKNLLLAFCFVMAAITLQAQVTQINSNKSLQVNFPLNNTKAIVVSDLDNSLWVTDGSLAGTIQISNTITYDGDGQVLSGKFIFRGNNVATGSEIYITDGTIVGTELVSDIYPGVISSNPGDLVLMGGFIYFSAVTAAHGRELWKTNGTLAGTSLVKDIVPGTDSSNNENNFNLFSNGSYLLFAAKSAAGIELWKSDGTNAGTNLLADINTGNAGADSSNPANFFTLNTMVLFTATNFTTGREVWRTDGSTAGTVLLKDINPGAGSGTEIELFPGFSLPVFIGFHVFNNKAYFQATDGTDTGLLWGTDGNAAGTSLIKNIVSGSMFSFLLTVDAVNLPGKFIFPVSDGDTRSELWQSDGTPAGTTLFKSFTAVQSGDFPVIFVPYYIDYNTGNFSQVLFQGNKFFFTAATATEGNELWISDGSLAGTNIVKDINPGAADGTPPQNLSYTYTATALFFPADNTVNGLELWKSDGTTGGTNIVADIITGAQGSDPVMSGFIVNNKVLFTADNGDSPAMPVETDLYAVDGNFIPLPVRLVQFDVIARSADALINWQTIQEINSKEFIVQRSFDGMVFTEIAVIPAAGNTSTKQFYSFTDAGIINCGKPVLYYRLLSADIDGTKVYSDVQLLKLKTTNWSMRLLRNPVKDVISISLTGAGGNVQVQVNDMNGKAMYSGKVQYTNTIINIPAANLPPGMYVLIVSKADDRKFIRFVK